MESLFHQIKDKRQLFTQLLKREILGRYKGSLMGLAWSFVHPVIMLAVYTFVFGYVFKSRWGMNGVENPATFAVILFAGLIVFNIFAECINRAPLLIVSNANYVKKVVFPLEILAVVAVGSALFHACISSMILFAACIIFKQSVGWMVIYLPLIIIPFLLATLGFTWILSALGVYLRDIAQIAPVATTILLFASPVFYRISVLPENIQTLIMLNPLTFVVEQVRGVVFLSQAPDWLGLLVYTGCCFMILIGGYWWFQKTRKGFADVI
jgi:lipopolysaccharide transport system permease protein